MTFYVNRKGFDLSNPRTDTPREIAVQLGRGNADFDVDGAARAIASAVGARSIDDRISDRFDGRAFSVSASGGRRPGGEVFRHVRGLRPPPRRGRRMTLTGNGRDPAMTLSRAITPADIEVRGWPDALAYLSANAQPGTIGELRFIGHGRPGSQHLGDTQLGLSFSRGGRHHRLVIQSPGPSGMLGRDAEEELARLRPFFTPGAVVHLEGCNVGRDEVGRAFLTRLATVLGVRVRAGDYYQRLTPGYEGRVIECRPSRGRVADCVTPDRDGAPMGLQRADAVMLGPTGDMRQQTSASAHRTARAFLAAARAGNNSRSHYVAALRQFVIAANDAGKTNPTQQLRILREAVQAAAEAARGNQGQSTDAALTNAYNEVLKTIGQVPVQLPRDFLMTIPTESHRTQVRQHIRHYRTHFFGARQDASHLRVR